MFFEKKIEDFYLSVVLEKVKEYDKDEIAVEVQKMLSETKIVSLPDGHLENHCRLYKAMEEFIEENGFNAISLKCWPELGNFKFTPCAVISRFADKKYIIGCESDVDATITMLIQQYLTEDFVFMSDLINIDENENSALFWHCGQAATKLKNSNSDLYMSNHPLAGQGTAYETTLKPGTVTIARMSKIGDSYKLFLIKGTAIPTEKVTKGVMVNVVLDKPVLKTIYAIAEEGVPHHYSIVWQDVVEEMTLMCKMMGIEVIEI